MLVLLAFVGGVAAGLRSMLPLAVVAWAVQGSPEVGATSIAFMGSRAAAWILTLLAAGELVADKLPLVPSRLKPGPLAARVVSGAFCGIVICVAAAGSGLAHAIAGGIGAITGAYAGYHVRRRLTAVNRFPDLPVALVEDVIAIALAVFAVSRV